MEKLTAFEFVAADAGPQLVRIKKGDTVLAQFGFCSWIGVDLSTFEIFFEKKEDLTIEGVGLGHPYWNGELPPWAVAFNSKAEEKRINTILVMAQRVVTSASLSV